MEGHIQTKTNGETVVRMKMKVEGHLNVCFLFVFVEKDFRATKFLRRKRNRSLHTTFSESLLEIANPFVWRERELVNLQRNVM